MLPSLPRIAALRFEEGRLAYTFHDGIQWMDNEPVAPARKRRHTSLRLRGSCPASTEWSRYSFLSTEAFQSLLEESITTGTRKSDDDKNKPAIFFPSFPQYAIAPAHGKNVHATRARHTLNITVRRRGVGTTELPHERGPTNKRSYLLFLLPHPGPPTGFQPCYDCKIKGGVVLMHKYARCSALLCSALLCTSV